MNAQVKAHTSLFILAVTLLVSAQSWAQTTSQGPGKGPPTPGSGKSKYTYPQPPKPTKYSMNSIRPAYQVPENPEKYLWKLTSKEDGRDPLKPTNEVPVYGFGRDGRRVIVGFASAGETISLDEIRAVGKSIYYKIDWKGAQTNKNAIVNEYWVSGSNIEYAGNR